MKLRAYSPAEKKALIARLLDVWLANPHQRLGQLIVNALPHEAGNDAFYIEDYTLIERLEKPWG
jgi:hypothetical protein